MIQPLELCEANIRLIGTITEAHVLLRELAKSGLIRGAFKESAERVGAELLEYMPRPQSQRFATRFRSLEPAFEEGGL